MVTIKPTPIAHRSGPENYPEQTLRAALDAVSAGAEVVEVDVRLTKDLQLAVTHDLNLSRVFGIDRDIDTMTAAEFSTLHHKANPEYGSHFLTDYLDAVPVPLLIHVKESRSEALTTQVIQVLLQTISRYDCAERVILGIPTLAAAQQIRDHDPRISILSFSGFKAIPDFLQFRPNYIRLWENWLEDSLVQAVRASGAQLWVMSGVTAHNTTGVPTEEGLEKILSYAPDGILINHVSRLTKRA